MEKIFHIIIVSLEYLVDTKHSTKGYSIFTVNLQYFWNRYKLSPHLLEFKSGKN